MAGKLPLNKFLEYFSKPMSEEEIWGLHAINNIEWELVELYQDFVVSLLDLIDMTYLGDDVMSEETTQSSHFNWCWERTIENFRLENIRFTKNGEHHTYFLKYSKDLFYNNKEKTPNMMAGILDFWRRVLCMSTIKTRSEYDLFKDVYQLLGDGIFRPCNN